MDTADRGWPSMAAIHVMKLFILVAANVWFRPICHLRKHEPLNIALAKQHGNSGAQAPKTTNHAPKTKKTRAFQLRVFLNFW